MVRDMRGMRGKSCVVVAGGRFGIGFFNSRLHGAGRAPVWRQPWRETYTGNTTKTLEVAHTCIYADWLYFFPKKFSAAIFGASPMRSETCRWRPRARGGPRRPFIWVGFVLSQGSVGFLIGAGMNEPGPRRPPPVLPGFSRQWSDQEMTREGSQLSRAAASSAERSILIIPIMASIALGWLIKLPILRGTICQHKPKRSVSQPQAMDLPPSINLSQ